MKIVKALASSLRDRGFVKSMKRLLKLIVLAACWQVAMAVCPVFGQEVDSLKRREALLTAAMVTLMLVNMIAVQVLTEMGL